MTNEQTEAPSPLWCANEEPHEAHSARNEFNGTNYCTGRPPLPAPSEDERKRAVLAVARSMPGWNDDTTEPGITDPLFKQRAEEHWERVNAECIRQARGYIDALVAAGFPLASRPTPPEHGSPTKWQCAACGHWCNSDGAGGWICSKRGGCGSEYPADWPGVSGTPPEDVAARAFDAIQRRLIEGDVPMNVAADIDQIITEREYLTAAVGRIPDLIVALANYDAVNDDAVEEAVWAALDEVGIALAARPLPETEECPERGRSDPCPRVGREQPVTTYTVRLPKDAKTGKFQTVEQRARPVGKILLAHEATTRRNEMNDEKMTALIDEAREFTFGWESDGTAMRPFDQSATIRHWDAPSWRSLPAAKRHEREADMKAWEERHGHDVRLKCYPEFGCAAIETYAADLVFRLVAALSSHPDEETEWEYGLDTRGEGVRAGLTFAQAENALDLWYNAQVVRRRPAGPWLPVPADGAMT